MFVLELTFSKIPDSFSSWQDFFYTLKCEEPDNYLNAFGNLVLLSPGENSSYSNQTVGKKQEDFKAKPVYDSLKLKQIFELKQNDEWDKDKIKQHQKEMVDLLISHYASIDNGVLNG